MVASPKKRPNSTSSSNGRGSKKAPVEIPSDDDVEVVKDDGDDDDDEEEEDEEYEIEAIRAHRGDKSNPGYLEYLIKWKGYPEKDNTWEPEENAKNSQVIIDDYWRSKPSKSQVNKFEKETKKSKKRTSTSGKRDADEDSPNEFLDAEDDVEDDVPPSKKARKASGSVKKQRAASSDVEADGDDEQLLAEDDRQRMVQEVTDETLAKYKKYDDWESIVEGVETMERGEDEVLMARLIFKRDKGYSRRLRDLGATEEAEEGPRAWVKEHQASKKCPQKVIQFYREHLRFSRPARPEDSDDK